MAYDFTTSNGDGREYTRDSYGKAVTSGGGRRSGMQPTAPTFDPQSFSQASVAPDAPRVPNLTATNPELYHTAGEIDANRKQYGWDPTRGSNFGYGDGVDVGSLYRDAPGGQQGDVQYAPSVQALRDAGPSYGIQPGPGGAPSAGGARGNTASRLEGQVKAYGDMVGQDFKRSVGSMLGDLNGIGALRSGAVPTGINDFTTNYGRQIGNYAAQTATDAERIDQQESEFGRSLASQNRQFDESLGFERDRFGADDRYRNTALASENSRFDRGLTEQGRQFDSGLGQRDKEYTNDSAFRFNEAQRDEADRNIERNFRNRQYADQQNASRKRGIGKLLGGIAGGVGGFLTGGPGGAIAGAKTGSSIFG